jgi:hypothetical protein
MAGVLRGQVLGADRQELLSEARRIAATYFEVQPDFVAVDLSGETYAPRQGAGMDNREPRYAADFRAAVK